MSAARTPTPFTAASRNAVWVYPRVTPPRFANAPSIVETARAHEKPDFDTLPDGADVSVELYGGVVVFRLDGLNHRVYLEKYDYISFGNAARARYAFGLLWVAVENMNSAEDARTAAGAWRGEMEDQKDFSRRVVRKC